MSRDVTDTEFPIPDPEVAISVQNLTKIYKLYDSPMDRLKESLHPFRRKYHKDFYALNGVSFEIRKGETVGIIGKNGSGKSTLLKILTGVLTPTSGCVQVNGKVSALLELGAGFNPELTGLENVYFNGTLMGYKREEMDARLDEILAFADIGEFVHQPVKAYSSGMFVRLAFAVAVNVEPEILIVDEALSVGDVFFQQKCFAKMNTILNSGTTLLFVSHDMSGLQKLCGRGMLLKEGNVAFDGTSIECVSAYYLPDKSGDIIDDNRSYSAVEPCTIPIADNGSSIFKNTIINESSNQQGDKGLEILAVALNTNIAYQVEYCSNATIDVLVRANMCIRLPVVGIAIFDRINNLVFSTNTLMLGHKLKQMNPYNEVIVSFNIGFNLQPGFYTLSVGCNETEPEDHGNSYLHHRWVGLGPINVVNSGQSLAFHGIAKLPCEVKLSEPSI